MRRSFDRETSDRPFSDTMPPSPEGVSDQWKRFWDRLCVLAGKRLLTPLNDLDNSIGGLGDPDPETERAWTERINQLYNARPWRDPLNPENTVILNAGQPPMVQRLPDRNFRLSFEPREFEDALRRHCAGRGPNPEHVGYLRPEGMPGMIQVVSKMTCDGFEFGRQASSQQQRRYLARLMGMPGPMDGERDSLNNSGGSPPGGAGAGNRPGAQNGNRNSQNTSAGYAASDNLNNSYVNGPTESSVVSNSTSAGNSADRFAGFVEALSTTSNARPSTNVVSVAGTGRSNCYTDSSSNQSAAATSRAAPATSPTSTGNSMSSSGPSSRRHNVPQRPKKGKK